MSAARSSAPATRDIRAAAPPSALTPDDRLALLRFMVLMRTVEERGLTLYKQGKVPGSFYDGRGQEAISVGATFALASTDRVCSPLIRDLGAHLVRGTDLTEIFRHYLGRDNALSRGREGNVHFGDRSRGIVAMVSMLPDMMVVATGLAMAFKLRGQRRCALSFFGDGASSRGDFHEAMNWAGLHQLPVIFVLENNQLAYSTPTDRQFAVSPVHRAEGYGIAAETIDGNDPEAVFEATLRARERALTGRGPTLLEAVTMRMHGHGAHDDMRYVPKERLDDWRARDPIKRYGRRLQEEGVELEDVRAAARQQVDAAIARALEACMPDGETAIDRLFADEPSLLQDGGDAPWSGFAETDRGAP